MIPIPKGVDYELSFVHFDQSPDSILGMATWWDKVGMGGFRVMWGGVGLKLCGAG